MKKNTNFLKKLAVKSQITLKYQILDLKSQYRSIFPQLGTSAMWGPGDWGAGSNVRPSTQNLEVILISVVKRPELGTLRCLLYIL